MCERVNWVENGCTRGLTVSGVHGDGLDGAHLVVQGAFLGTSGGDGSGSRVGVPIVKDVVFPLKGGKYSCAISARSFFMINDCQGLTRYLPSGAAAPAPPLKLTAA